MWAFLAGVAATIVAEVLFLIWFCRRNAFPRPRRRKPLDSILKVKMNDPKHILVSKTFWLHALTLVAVAITALQGQDWLAQYPYATPILASVSAVVAIWVRFLTDSPVRIKSAAILLAAMLFASQAGAAEPVEALAKVNALRQSRGLRPFIFDAGLTRAAKGCAKFRADRLIEGRYKDFSAVPAGTRADAAGCAAWPKHMGFGACCVFDNYRFAGAASCEGRDGQMYHHIFVRR